MCLPSKKTAASGVEVICKAEGLFEPMALQPDKKVITAKLHVMSNRSFLSIAYKVALHCVQCKHLFMPGLMSCG